MIAEYESVTAHFYKSMETETISLKGITSYNRFIHVSDLIWKEQSVDSFMFSSVDVFIFDKRKSSYVAFAWCIIFRTE